MADQDYSKHFSEGGFWKTIGKFGRGIPFLRNALAMFYCWLDPETPLWVKSIIIAALGYFILPFDAIPDIIPGLGLTDDAAVIAGAFAAINAFIKPDHWQQADAKLGNI